MTGFLNKGISTLKGTIILVIFSTLLGGSIISYYNSRIPQPYEEQLVMPGKTKKTVTIYLYYYNKNADSKMGCEQEAVLPVERKIPVSMTPIQDAVKFLLLGQLTEEEKLEGFNTEFPLEGLKLTAADLKDGILTLYFDDPFNKTGGGSCRVGILWTQIRKTAEQFSVVEKVQFEPDWVFQP